MDYQFTELARKRAADIFEQVAHSRGRTFGNARHVRNVFERSIKAQANRIAVMSNITEDVLFMLEDTDITPAKWSTYCQPLSVCAYSPSLRSS